MRNNDQQSLALALAITAAVMVVEAAGGWLSNSLALLSDAGHMLTDTMALGLSLLALRFASRPPTPEKTFGFYRLEILAALANGAILLAVCGSIFYEAYQRLFRPPAVDSRVMLAVAAMGLVANLAGMWLLRRSSRRSLNVRSAYFHVLGDALSSTAVLGGGILILFTGWTLVDPLLSLLIGVVILRGAYGLLAESVHILLEAAPKEMNVQEIVQAIKGIPGVRDVHHVHLWAITSGLYALSAHVLIEDVLTSRSARILDAINRLLLDRFRIGHTTIQFECKRCQEHPVCPLERNAWNPRFRKDGAPLRPRKARDGETPRPEPARGVFG